ncbi:hypothetical protein EDS67_18285 [candidate division KSB1 bacterium]|nr:MAG: hypothetical protein EDS67_18285 [candidate division KSB1 bacterium]MCE7943137.1 hypothetical protein [Chlorobi bacterium CHB1]
MSLAFLRFFRRRPRSNRRRSSRPAGQFIVTERRVYQPPSRVIPPDWAQPANARKHVIFVRNSLLAKVKEHAQRDLSHECFGLLLGNAYSDPIRKVLWIEVQEAVAAVDTNASIVAVEVSTKEFRRLNDEVDKIWDETKGETRKIGWYHSHPNFGIFMSGTDQANQKQFYSQEWQIALVVDPVREEIGFFRGAESEACQYILIDDLANEKAAVAPTEEQHPVTETPAIEPPATETELLAPAEAQPLEPERQASIEETDPPPMAMPEQSFESLIQSKASFWKRILQRARRFKR